MSSSHLRIILLEDMPTDAELIMRELRRANFVFTATRLDTREAFEFALSESPPDLIISDFSLPQFDAIAALHLVKQYRPGTPFILVTGSLTEEVAVECMKEGADDYILKASLRRLPSAVLNVLEKKSRRWSGRRRWRRCSAASGRFATWWTSCRSPFTRVIRPG